MINDKHKYYISVIVPAFKQEKYIQKDLIRLESVLGKLNYPFEIILVVDGIVDKTFENARKIKSKNIKVYGYAKNWGKGYAVRYGMVRSKGNIVGFIDSGMDLNPEGISVVMEKFLQEDADIIIGSKRHILSKVNYPLERKILSVCGQLLIKLLFGLDIRDTQVGMKFFRRKVLETVLPRLLVKRFAFDIEVLAVSRYLGFSRIFEAPVEINYNFESSVLSKQIFRVLMDTFIDTLAIYYRLAVLHYYDDGNKRKWKHDPELNMRVNIS